jgi:hypothetical protein
MSKLPVRLRSLQLETVSQRFFESILPENWACTKPVDYGIDLIVDIFHGRFATGLTLIVQLKSSEKESPGENEKVRLYVSTYNYLQNRLEVAIIVKYIYPINDGYWIYLKDVPAPQQQRETFTIYLPKENKLSNINWGDIENYVQSVTSRKLAAQRAWVLKQSIKNNEAE